MKIAVIGSKGIPATSGGIERHVEEVYSRLAALGHKVTVFCRPSFTGRHDSYTYEGIEIRSLPSINTKHLDAISHTLASSVISLREDFDIIHYHGIGPAVLSFMPRFKPSVKVCATIHALDWQREKWGTLAKKFLRLSERASITFPHKTIVVSKWLKDYCEQRYKTEVAYIPNGVSPGIKQAPGDAFYQLGLREKGYLFFAGRLVPEKGCRHLIAAYEAIKTDLKLVIAGESSHTDDYEAKLRDLAADDQRILFTGKISGNLLDQIYANAYAFVLPSDMEGLPIALLEALSLGIPVLCSDIAPNKEIVGARQQYGLTFQVGNEDDLKQKIEFMLEHEAAVNKLGAEGRKHVIATYNWDNIAQSVAQVYKSITTASHTETIKKAENTTAI